MLEIINNSSPDRTILQIGNIKAVYFRSTPIALHLNNKTYIASDTNSRDADNVVNWFIRECNLKDKQTYYYSRREIKAMIEKHIAIVE